MTALGVTALRRLALVLVLLLGSEVSAPAQLEPEVFTASRALNKALGSNPPDVATAADLLIGYDRPHNRQLLTTKWVTLLAERATGDTDSKRKKVADLIDAFEDSFGDGEGAKQRARTFIELRDELLGRATPKKEIEQSAAVFVERLRKLPEPQRNVLQGFGWQAKVRIPELVR